MVTLSYYEVTENTDKTEGRGPTRGTGIAFRTKEDAVRFVSSDFYKRFAVMGVVSSGYAEYSVDKRYVYLYDDFEQYKVEGVEQENQEKLNAALDKLTAEEYNLIIAATERR